MIKFMWEITQYVAGLASKAMELLPPLSIASNTSSSVNCSYEKLVLSLTIFTTASARLLERKKPESSSATKGINGNCLFNSVHKEYKWLIKKGYQRNEIVHSLHTPCL